MALVALPLGLMAFLPRWGTRDPRPPSQSLAGISSQNPAITITGGRRDFDFLHGSWVVRSRRLRQRLTGSEDWEVSQWPSTVVPLLDGLVTIDTFAIPVGSDTVRGMTHRGFDPATNEWVISVATVAAPLLVEQVRGGFTGSTGEFHGVERWDGATRALRYRWVVLDRDHARWEQAYWDSARDAWETNWVMDYVRRPLPETNE